MILDYKPQPRQQLLHSAACRQIFYGGAAGGGKSWAVLNEAIAFCLANPGLQAYLFRRVLPELESNHLRYLRALPKEYGTYHETRRQFIFAVKDKRGQSSVLHAGYAEQEKDIWDYRGREMHAVYVDEASQWTELQLAVLRAWNRIGSWEPDPRYRHVFPRCVFASNPGGPGHNFLKQTFIDPAPAGTVFYDTEMRDPKNPDDPGWPTIFIRSTMEDNRYLDANYAASFGGLPPEMRKAYTEGDWDVVPGAALELLSRDRHMLRNFTPPRHWTHFLGLDWGTAAPFSVGWYCVSDGALLAAKDGWPETWLPHGAIIRYREWYGWDGKPNHGCRWDSGRVARRILEIEKENNDPPMDFRVADTQMWAQVDGASIADRFLAEGVVLGQAKKDRKAGYEEIRSRLAGSPCFMQDGELGDSPMLFATAQCKHFWRTLPPLTLDETDPDKGPAEKQEDHCVVKDTPLIFDDGCHTIGSRVGQSGKVWTPLGWQNYRNCRLTRRDAEIVDVYAGNRKILTCTPDHKLMTTRGWVEARDCVGQTLLSSTPKHRHSVVCDINHTKNIASRGIKCPTIKPVMARCTAWFGSIIGIRSQKDRIFITLTETPETMRWRIWNAWRDGNITRNTPVLAIPLFNGKWLKDWLSGEKRQSTGPRSWFASIVSELMSPMSLVLRSIGDFAPRVAVVAPIGDCGSLQKLNGSGHARHARKNSQRKPITKDFVPYLATTKTTITEIRPAGKSDVYCLTVPNAGCFSLSDGTVISNCYDELMYACRRRPYVTTERDRWKEEVSALRLDRKMLDPYSTGA